MDHGSGVGEFFYFTGDDEFGEEKEGDQEYVPSWFSKSFCRDTLLG